ncbi:trimethylguanosine synthase [Anopheles nili]|uniref:trimethylguanosine synthase n=1 Tax=Anopheles nili TaxID=185578 RepID=UPI00237BE600|nr:trimethylguanosine synthase [Anopheles nili]
MNASESHWEPLAEIYMSHPLVKDNKNSIYCLCSRVFIKNYYDVYVSTLERGDSVPLNSSSMDPVASTEQKNASPTAIKAVQVKETALGIREPCTEQALPKCGEEILDILDRAEVDDVFIEEPLVKQLSFGRDGSRKMASKWGDRDTGTTSDVSCYFSASASHSDTNYCSTDEHEHVFHTPAGGSQNMAVLANCSSTRNFTSSGLQSSDSGADLSERVHERKLSLKDELLESSRRTVDNEHPLETVPTVGSSLASMERNNSLPEAFGREDLHEAWEAYWNKHGEAIIWASWIEKYSDYINPEYLDSGEQGQATGTNTPHDKSEATPGTATEVDKDFSFDNDAITATASMEIVVSACSPHPYTKSTYQASNWPLPFSSGGDDFLWNTHRSGSCENEALLSPRCDSVTSSIPLTIGTTDSMTNVTRMTISSYDFCSSKVSSESSNLSECLSSEVSNESSNSSDMLETEYLVGVDRTGEAPVPQDEEAAMDGEQYWQILWQQHFQELYAKQYHHFMADHSHELLPGVCAEHSAGIKYDKRKRNSSNGSCKTSTKSFQRREEQQLPEMVAEMRLNGETGSEKTYKPNDGDDKAGEKCSTECKKSDSLTTEDLSVMLQSYGLPTSFGKPSRSLTGDGEDRPPNEKPINLKRSHESDNEETPKERLKAAFELMGYCFSDPANETESIINISGEVVYRKKHIRLHNRVLKMKHHKPKHTYFDDDGNEFSLASANDKTDTEALLLHSSSDDDEANPGALGRASVRSSTILEYNLQQAIGKDVELNDKESAERIEATAEPSFLASSGSGCTMPNSIKKEKKKKRKTKFVASLPLDIANDRSLLKYWYKRFSLFSLFDSGIRLDRESWFSVTPEKVAAHTAERCRSDVVVDAFCGCGGNSIQFAFSCHKVIAIDIDPRKIEMARHNATVYGVADRIEFIIGDFMQVADRLRADVIFLSPPWGGPGYLKNEVYDIEQSLLPVPATQLMETAQRVSKNVALYLPRNSNTQQLTMLAGPNGAVEIEQNFLDRKLIALTAYYGELINE